ncbi:MAG: DtxR family transcriptional regulator [Microbacteriaceae bacterium]|nr:DtxR family transcriptional regulator [Microbacteriaceae bacterium]
MVSAPTAIEDYVKVIYSHTEWQPEPIGTGELAARLGLAASSVTEMVKKLVAQGLVTHEPYGAVELTPDGTALALRMVRRHRLIETWLVQQFGYGWHEVHDEAEVLEHTMSDRLLEAIDVQLGRPTRDPHGDPIPASDGSIARPPAVLLGGLAVGDHARVLRISDRDPLLLRHLEAEGITLDIDVELTGRTAFGALVVVDGQSHDLGNEALASIWVGRAGAQSPPPSR